MGAPTAAIRKALAGSVNFMTPEFVENGWIVDGALGYELSTGSGMFDDKPLYGVTVVKFYPNRRNQLMHGLSTMCNTLPEAREYIANLKQEWTTEGGGLKTTLFDEITDPNNERI